MLITTPKTFFVCKVTVTFEHHDSISSSLSPTQHLYHIFRTSFKVFLRHCVHKNVVYMNVITWRQDCSRFFVRLEAPENFLSNPQYFKLNYYINDKVTFWGNVLEVIIWQGWQSKRGTFYQNVYSNVDVTLICTNWAPPTLNQQEKPRQKQMITFSCKVNKTVWQMQVTGEIVFLEFFFYKLASSNKGKIIRKLCHLAK